MLCTADILPAKAPVCAHCHDKPDNKDLLLILLGIPNAGHLTGCFDHSDSEEDEPQLPAVKDSGETEELPDKDRGPKSPDVKRKILWAFRLSWAVNF